MHCRPMPRASVQHPYDLPLGGTDMKSQMTLIVAAIVLTFGATASAQTQTQATSYCTQGNTTSSSCSFTALPSAGDFILIQGQRWATTGVVTGCSDNQGNSYSVAVQSSLAAGVISAFICYATNIGTPSGTFTVTVSSGSDASWWNFKATSWSGMATASALDVTAVNAGGFGTPPSSGATGALAQANNLVAASVGISTTQTSITVEALSPAWTQQFEELSANVTIAGEADTRVISSSSAQTANWILSTDGVWSAVIAVFKGDACSGGVSDGSASNTQEKIDAAANGSVVCVPAGSWSWDQTVTIPADKGITVRGAGIGLTNITVSSSVGNPRRAFDLWVSPGNALSRITGFTIDQGSVANCVTWCAPIAVIGHGVNKFRVDHNRLEGLNQYGAGVIVIGTTLEIASVNGAEISGLIDNNDIYCHQTLNWSCHPTLVVASPAWDGPSDLATNIAAGWGRPFTRDVELGSDKSIYIEKNTFYLNGIYQDGLLDTFGGAQVVFRYNVAHGSAPGNHGFDSAGYRGPRWMEIYGNQLNLGSDNPNCGNYRGGLLLYFDNTCGRSGGAPAIALQLYRARGAIQQDIDIFFGVHGPCDGENNAVHQVNVDGNQGTGFNTVAEYPSTGSGGDPGWPCLDQIGWHFDEDGAAGHASYPAYIFNNKDATSEAELTVGNYELPYGNLQNYMKCNRDYYIANVASFDGSKEEGNCSTGGVDVGLLAARPTTCTAGVAYWATDAGGNWNTTNTSANDGRLYRCKATGSWSDDNDAETYTPYQYPHPLAN